MWAGEPANVQIKIYENMFSDLPLPWWTFLWYNMYPTEFVKEWLSFRIKLDLRERLWYAGPLQCASPVQARILNYKCSTTITFSANETTNSWRDSISWKCIFWNGQPTKTTDFQEASARTRTYSTQDTKKHKRTHVVPVSVKKVQQQTKPAVKPAAAPVKEAHLAQPNDETLNLDAIIIR